MKKIIYILTFGLTCTTAYSQGDTHYSQFYSVPLAINPATAGIMEGTARAILDYRTQWSSVTTPWRTMAFAGDFKFGEDEESGNFFNGGIFIHNDKAGDSQFKTGLYNLAFGYTVKTGKTAYFTSAIQGGLIQNSVVYDDLYWETQYNGHKFDTSLPTEEVNTGKAAFNRLDLSIGLHYFNEVSDNTSLFFGVAGNHLLAHNVSFTPNLKDNIFRKIVGHGGGQFIFGKCAVLPNFLVAFQGPNQVINIGSDFKVWLKEQSHFTGFNDEISFSVGSYYRLGDAVLFAGKMNYSGFTLAGSYDFNISGFNVATGGRGGLEILLMYRANFGIGKGKSTKFL